MKEHTDFAQWEHGITLITFPVGNLETVLSFLLTSSGSCCPPPGIKKR